jgi:hypothetical protein
VYLVQSRIDDAILWLEKARVAAPELPWAHLRLAAAYGLKGDTAHAAAELAEARRTEHRGHDLSIAHLKAGLWPPANIGALFETTYYAGLRKAGVPQK